MQSNASDCLAFNYRIGAFIGYYLLTCLFIVYQMLLPQNCSFPEAIALLFQRTILKL